jgi:hypothetical protein
MFSLLMLSLALAAPAAAAQLAPATSDQLGAFSQSLALLQPKIDAATVDQQPRLSDNLQVRPDSDICYKIRAFVFSQGSHPKLLRETTCGPKAPTAKSIEGAKPRLVPLGGKDWPELSGQK